MILSAAVCRVHDLFALNKKRLCSTETVLTTCWVSEVHKHQYHRSTWWRHQIKTLLAFYAGNSPMFSLNSAWTSSWTNNGDVGDLRRQRDHHEIIAMHEADIGKSVTKIDGQFYWQNYHFYSLKWRYLILIWGAYSGSYHFITPSKYFAKFTLVPYKAKVRYLVDIFCK